MVARRKPDYRDIKRQLNRYSTFSFPMPRKGKDFTPQQKSSLTRKYRRLKTVVDNDTITWFPYPEGSKLPHLDGIRTTKGIFYKYPDAKLVKKGRKYQVLVTPKSKGKKILVQRSKELLFLFPPSIVGNPDAIEKWVEALRKKYKPDDIRWSTTNRRESIRYDAKLFNFYFDLESIGKFSETDYWKHKKYLETLDKNPDYYNGVFFIWYFRSK